MTWRCIAIEFAAHYSRLDQVAARLLQHDAPCPGCLPGIPAHGPGRCPGLVALHNRRQRRQPVYSTTLHYTRMSWRRQPQRNSTNGTPLRGHHRPHCKGQGRHRCGTRAAEARISLCTGSQFLQIGGLRPGFFACATLKPVTAMTLYKQMLTF